jgi:hypothetical protein
MISTNFFSAVAHHNLERFHSECISWIFKYDKLLAKKFILKYFAVKQEFKDINSFEDEEIYCVTEFDNLDIVLIFKFKHEDEFRALVIENKIKAKEHFFEEKNKLGSINKISQTQYYFNRKFAIKKIELEGNERTITISNGVDKVKNNQNQISILKNNICWLYLIPLKIDFNSLKQIDSIIDTTKFEKLNVWDYDYQQINFVQAENPWITISYGELLLFIENNRNTQLTEDSNAIIFQEYRNYLKNRTTGFIYELNGTSAPRTVDLRKYRDNKFGQFEYFKVLLELLKIMLNNLSLEYTIESSSSNSKDPLININLRKEDIVYSNSSNHQLGIILGIQIQGETFKYFVSAQNYNNINFKKNDENDMRLRAEYHKEVSNILCDLPDNVKSHYNKIRLSSTKTFCSRTHNNRDIKEGDIEEFDIVSKAEKYAERIKNIMQFRT